MMSLKLELSRLSQIDANVSEIGTRAGEADSRMYKPLQNAFGVCEGAMRVPVKPVPGSHL